MKANIPARIAHVCCEVHKLFPFDVLSMISSFLSLSKIEKEKRRSLNLSSAILVFAFAKLRKLTQTF